MPWAPRRRCANPECSSRATTRGLCRAHANRSSRNHHGIPRQARGLGADNDRARREVQGGPCVLRLPGCTGTATSLEHLVPRSQGGTLADGYAGACDHCQRAQGARLSRAG